jgi:hypothetical protein
MNRFTGGCHCGNIDVVFETAGEAAALEVRACSCSFCRKHGARAATDPAGRLRLTVADGRHLERYLFGQRTAEFLVCNKCGVYVAAIQDEPEGLRGTLNINTLVDARAFTSPVVAVDFSAESTAQRRARRKAKWTPAELAIGTPSLAIAGKIGDSVPA